MNRATGERGTSDRKPAGSGCVLLSVQATAGHKGRLALFCQIRGQVLYYCTAGIHTGKWERWQCLESVGKVFKINHRNGGRLFPASVVCIFPFCLVHTCVSSRADMFKLS